MRGISVKKILCFAIASALALLTSCSHEVKTEGISSTLSTVQSTVSYLNAEDSDANKYIQSLDTSQGFECSLEVTRQNKTVLYYLTSKDGRFYVSAADASETYCYDGNETYLLSEENKTAALLTGTRPYAVTLALSFTSSDLLYFVQEGTKELNGVKYNYEGFLTKKDDLRQTVLYYLNEDNSIAYIEYNSTESEELHALIKLVSVTNTPNTELLRIPEDYTING